MALGRLSTLKTLIGVSLTDTTYDELMKNYMDASSAAFESACGTKYELATYNEHYTVNPHNDNQRLYIKHVPVVSIYAVSMSASAISVGMCSMRGNQLYCSTGFSRGIDALRVSYSAGYNTTGWASLGLYNKSLVSYTGFVSINNGVVSILNSFAASASIAKASIPTSDPSLQIWQWTVKGGYTVGWNVPYDMEQVIVEDCAIQILKIKPTDGTLSTIGDGRIGLVKINRGLYKGSTDMAEFEKYVEGYSVRWKQTVAKYRSLYYACN